MKKETLLKIRTIVDYHFYPGAGEALFPTTATIKYSSRTGRAKEIYYRGNLLATLQPIYGIYIPTLEGFRRLCRRFKYPRFRVTIKNDVANIIKQGKNVFAKHVVKADTNIRIEDEVAVTDEKGDLLAVGKAVLSGKAMTSFRRGIAVRVRHGVAEK